MNKDHHSTHELDKELRTSLEWLEHIEKPDVPPISFFENLVAEETKRTKKQLAKELSLFACLAAAILFCFAAILIKLPSIFLILQGAVLISAVLFLYKDLRKEGEWRDT